MHPGELLQEEFMNPLGLSAGKVAKSNTALRLARLLGVSAQYWANPQSHCGLEMAVLKLEKTIDRIQPVGTAA